jgi:hypothetical protein
MRVDTAPASAAASDFPAAQSARSIPSSTPIRPAELAEALLESSLSLDDAGVPVPGLIVVDLDGAGGAGHDQAVRAAAFASSLVVGVASEQLSEPARQLAREFLCTVVPSGAECVASEVGVSDVQAALRGLALVVRDHPRASVALSGLLRITAAAPVRDGLAAESAVYSMLLAGSEFADWLRGRTRRDRSPSPGPAVLLERYGSTLDITINRPERHNAFDCFVRDGLVEAFDLVLADLSITCVEFTGAGRSFCSGGDLDEFGTNSDVSTAHLIRLDRSVAARLDGCRDRVVARLHGACIGAGIEIPSYAGRVVARGDTWCQLPEIAMGLVPGAGGTVGITRRIGRWRTAYLALLGLRLDVATALSWGLVDAIDNS